MDPNAIAQMLAPLSPEARAELLNQLRMGFDHLVGMHFEVAGPTEVRVTLDARPEHVQPYGVVHGGVYCTLIEATCSVGAAMAVMTEGKHAVGIENHTRFRRPSRAGARLSVRAIPCEDLGRTRVWTATVTDDQGTLVAEGTVHLRVLEPDAVLAGQQVKLQQD